MSSSAAQYILPPELTDQVIDHLHDDVLSLRACSLACRAWVHSARFHIFHDVKLTAACSEAFTILLETSPHISFFIMSLDIHEEPSKIYDKSDYLGTTIPIIAPKLTRLKTLRLTNVNIAQLHPKAQSAFFHHFSSIRSLSLSAVTFDTFRDFAALIAGHPLIEHLDVRYIWWKNASLHSASRWENILHTFPSSHSRLRRISLNDTSFNVIDWIMSHYRTLSINTLTNSTILKYDIPPMTRLLQFLGPSLEHLTICIHSIPRYPLDNRELEKAAIISSSTGLRTVCFDRLILTQRESLLCTWVPVLLAQVTSQCVEELSFILVWNRLDFLEAFDLEQIQDILIRPLFSGLKKVVFRSIGYVDPVEGARAISRRMGRLADRGLLVFYHESDAAPIILEGRK